MPGWGARCAWALLGPLLPLACAVDFDRHFVGADADCACAPAAPDGWEGPIAIATENEVCEELARSELTWCGACACDGEASCGAGSLTFAEPGCATPSEVAAVGTGDCVEVGVSGGLESVSGAPGEVNLECAPSGGGRSQVSFCALGVTSACQDAEVCAPSGSTVCVHRVGEWPCEAPFVARSFFTEDATSACESCACELAEGACVGLTTLFAGEGCTGSQQSVAHDGATCVTLADTPGSARHQLGDATCRPEGGRPQTAELATLCCLP